MVNCAFIFSAIVVFDSSVNGNIEWSRHTMLNLDTIEGSFRHASASNQVKSDIDALSLDGFMEEAKRIFDLENDAFSNDTNITQATNEWMDTTFPLSTEEMGLLLRLYVQCRTNESIALRTWCTGADAEGTFVTNNDSDDPPFCPPGVWTHPCTGRVLHRVNVTLTEHNAEYLWPWEGIKCDAFTEPTTITNLYLPGQGLSCRLQELDFSHMVSLEQLDLSQNHFYGPLPAWLGNMTMLRILNLSHNLFDGSIPLEFGDYSDVEIMDLSHNQLQAQSLSFFKLFTRLRYLDLSSNHFHIPLVSGMLKGMYLEYLNLSHNAFMGALPEFPHLPYLKIMDLSYNAFHGYLPPEMGSWGIINVQDIEEVPIVTHLDFSYNQFVGVIPNISNLTRLDYFSVYHNTLRGPFPSLSPRALHSNLPLLFGGNQYLCPLPERVRDTCVCSDGYGLYDENGRLDTSSRVINASAVSKRCRPCPSGWYSNATTHQQCQPCPRGFMTSSLMGRATQCIPCGPGTFANETATAHCLSCPVGTALNQMGQSACPLCPPGQFTDAKGAVSCQLCPVGSASSREGATSCTRCEPGSFAAYEGEMSCIPCPVGTYQRNTGSTVCESCPIGWNAPIRGLKICHPCRAGTYYHESIRHCRRCPPHSYTDTDGQLKCISCPNGTVAEGYGNIQCTRPVPRGTGRTNETVYEPCLPGWYNNGSFLTCQKCPVGTFSTIRGSSSCAPCQIGTYNPLPGATTCTLAPLGKYVPTSRAWQPRSCPPNTYTSILGAGTCHSCPPGTVKDLHATGNCSFPHPGQVLMNVEWERVLIEIIGASLETAIEQLISAFEMALLQQGVWNIVIHLLEMTRLSPESDAIQLEMAMEVPQSSLQQFSTFKATNIMQWVETRTKEGTSDCKLRPCNISTIVMNPVTNTALRNAFARQLVSLHLFNVSHSMIDIQMKNESLRKVHAAPCPTGTFWVNFTCRLCPPGHYSDTAGSIQCTPCQAQYYAESEGQNVCAKCRWNHDSLPGSSKCVECGWLTSECSGFWSNLLLMIVLSLVVIWHMWQRIVRMWRGDTRQQEEIEQSVLVASVRMYGRVVGGRKYEPMRTISMEN